MTYVNLSDARRALASAEELGLQIQPSVTAAVQAAGVVNNLAKSYNPNRPELPADPKQARAVAIDYGKNLAEAHAISHGASQLSPQTAQVIIKAVAESAPDWIAELHALFDAAVHGLTDALTDVPHGAEPDRLHHLTRPAFAAWQRAAGFSHEADMIVKARNRIATAAGEPGVKNRELWASLVLPPVGHGRDWTNTHGPQLRGWHEHRRCAVLRWRCLIDHEAFGLDLAQLGELPERVAHWDAWTAKARARHQHLFGRFD